MPSSLGEATAVAGWRQQLLPQILRTAAPLSAIAFGVVAVMLRSPVLTTVAWVALAPVVLSLTVLALARSWPYRIRAIGTIAAFVAASLICYAYIGFLAGPALLGAIAVVFSGLLLGARAMVVTVVVMALGLASFAIAMETGSLALPPDEDIAVARWGPWLRTSVVALLLWSLLGFTVLHVIERIERALTATRAALEAAHVAQAAQRSAEAAVVQAQSLDVVGRFAAAAVHEFNNALTVIHLSAHMSRSGLETDDEDVLETILSSTERAGRLTHQMLFLARADAGTPRILDLSEILVDLQPTLRTILPEDVRLEVETTTDVRTLADEGQVQQILLNLVINARDAVGPGGLVAVRSANVRIESHEGSNGVPAGTWSVIEVEDDGCGMDDEVQQRAFEAFFTTKERGRGTGLGLSTVATVVRERGGHVTLSSHEGRGTRITLYFPRAASAPSRDESVGGATPVRLDGRTILVIEDDDELRTWLARVFAAVGARVLQAGNGDTALAFVESMGRELDLLCTDAVIPGASPAVVIEALREIRPSASILLCSGYVDRQLVERGLQADALLLRKPFTPDTLLRHVAELLPGRAR